MYRLYRLDLNLEKLNVYYSSSIIDTFVAHEDLPIDLSALLLMNRDKWKAEKPLMWRAAETYRQITFEDLQLTFMNVGESYASERGTKRYPIDFT